MTPEQFVYWLQGFLEVSNAQTIDPNQTQIIKDHLELVFKKETPVRSPLVGTDRLPFDVGRRYCSSMGKPISEMDITISC